MITTGIEEGIATYVDDCSDSSGHLKVEQMWLELVSGLPQAPPGLGSRTGSHPHLGQNLLGRNLFAFWLTLRFPPDKQCERFGAGRRGISMTAATSAGMES